MHEAHLMNDLMRRIEAVARSQGARRVAAVKVWLGVLSHFSAAHFREHFKDASCNTLAAGARVEVVLSDDIHHPNAAGIVLESVEVED